MQNQDSIQKKEAILPASKSQDIYVEKCLFIPEPNDKYLSRQLYKELKLYEPIFNQVGYFVEIKHLEQIQNICSNLQISYIEHSLDKSFNMLRAENLEFYDYINIKNEIYELKQKLNIDTINIDIDKSLSSEIRKHIINMGPDGYKLIELMDKHINIKNRIALLNLSTKPNKPLQLVQKLPLNFLTEQAPALPCLIKTIDSDGIKTLIPKGIVASLVGAGGVGKTHLLAQLALCIAIDADFLGQYPIEKKGHVYIALGENNDDDIHRLFNKTFLGLIGSNNHPEYHKIAQEAASRIHKLSVTGMNATLINQNGEPSGFYTELLQQLKDQEPREGWSLIILDPISRFLGAEAEKDNAIATQVIALLEKMSLELKGRPTIIFGHHMGKGAISLDSTDQAASRGASALTDGVRLQINLEKLKDSNDNSQIRMKVVKSNHTGIPEAVILKKDYLGCLSFDHAASTTSIINSSKSKILNTKKSKLPTIHSIEEKDTDESVIMRIEDIKK